MRVHIAGFPRSGLSAVEGSASGSVAKFSGNEKKGPFHLRSNLE
jgi:hypothetical protein